MNESHLAAVLTLTCVLGLGISGLAQGTEGIRVKVPFEFVVGGTTVPVGTYTVGRLSLEALSGIEITGGSNGTFVLPIAVDGAYAGQAKLSFDQVGGKYLLSEAHTPGGIYTFALPRAMVALAQIKDQSTASSGGTN